MRGKMIFIMLVMLVGFEGMAWPHSTAGLKKITLEKHSPEIDDVAYYIERWVGKRVDDKGHAGRFAVWEFTSLEQQGDRLVVNMKIFDQKTSVMTPEILVLQRGAGNTWDHVDAHGGVITKGIYTYAKPGHPIGRLLMAVVLAAAILQLFAWLRARQLKHSAPSKEEGRGQGDALHRE